MTFMAGIRIILVGCFLGLFSMTACGTAADKKGVAAECAADGDCQEQDQKCLTNFKGGYCGKADCKADSDCPSGALCITHTDKKNYCFRECKDKSECNANRSANPANCSANVILASGKKGKKACVPPAG